MDGSCKCGQIKYKADDALKLVNCHCNMCRGMNGSAFSSYAVVRADSFVIEEGQDLLRAFPVTDRATKHFCGNCGTPIYNANPTTYPGVAILYLGSLQEYASLSPSVNIFCSSKLSWIDDLHLVPSLSGGPQRA